MNTNKEWEKEFDRMFPGFSDLEIQMPGVPDFLVEERAERDSARLAMQQHNTKLSLIKSFITEQIQKAREEEREAFSKKLQEAIKDTQSMEDLTARLFMIIVQATTSPTENGGSSQ